jgi:hypothetical protein
MALKVTELQNHEKYKKALKNEVKTMGPDVSDFYYFEKFPFTDTGPGPLLLLGKLAENKFFKAAKNTNAPIVGKGQCAKVGNDHEFALKMGKLPFNNVKADMGNPSNLKDVKSLSVQNAAAEPTDSALEGKARAKIVTLTKQFDSIKGRMTDGERKDLRQYFGRIQDFMEAGKYADAVKEMNATEKEIARVGNLLRKDAEKQVKDKAGKFVDADKIARASLDELKKVQAEIKALEEGIEKDERTVQSKSGLKGKAAQKSVVEKTAAIKQAKQKLDQLKPTIAGLAKADEGDTKVAKALLKEFMDTQARFNQVAKAALSAPGKIKDNPALKGARDDIRDKVKEMADASKWQKEQLKDSDKHGTGRHGAQTGVEKQARRMASDVTPDQAHNPSGTAQYTAEWKTTIKWEEKNGKRVIKKKAEIVKTVIDELNNTFGASKSSIFLNPALEKEAVDKAMKIANDQCVWTQWKNGNNWTDITSLTVVVPEPNTALGYGMATERAAGFVKTSAAAAANAVKQFESGKISIDELLKQLNVQLKTDSTGVGAAMIRRARVVLTRSNVNSPWKNKTQFPTDDPRAWEVAKNTPLNGKKVKSATVAETTAPMYS